MIEKIAYKLFAVDSDGALTSYYARGMFLETIYTPYEWTVPRYPAFCFSSMGNLRYHLYCVPPHNKGIVGYEIWECEVKNPRPCPYIIGLKYTDSDAYKIEIGKFWTAFNRGDRLEYGDLFANANIIGRPPVGTIACDSVMPINMLMIGEPE